jgi:cytidine deaminase
VDDACWKLLFENALYESEVNAYCPYSNFPVGASILWGSGRVTNGANVENASYGMTICAERSAVCRANCRQRDKIVAVAIYTPTDKPSAPCGACRQVLNEFGPDALVRSYCDSEDILEARLSDLLPHAFGPGNLT